MINFTRGSVTNIKTGVIKDIVVKAKSPNKFKDILIGGGLVLAGIAYLTSSAFYNGAIKYEEGELKALSDAGLLSNNMEDI